MKSIKYNYNRKQKPSRGLSAKEYVFNTDLDFYQDNTSYLDKFRDDLESTPVTRVYDLIWRGDLGKFPQYYFDNITKDRKCEQLLRYVYKHLYNFTRVEIMNMNHRQFLTDIKLSSIHTSGLFPNFREILSKVLIIDENLLKGKQHLNVSNRRKKLSTEMELKLQKELTNLPDRKNKKTSSKKFEIKLEDIPIKNNSKHELFGDEKKEHLYLKSLLKRKGKTDKKSAIQFLLLDECKDSKFLSIKQKYGQGLFLIRIAFPNITIEEFNSYK